jgi:hypothetical protein
MRNASEVIQQKQLGQLSLMPEIYSIIEKKIIDASLAFVDANVNVRVHLAELAWPSLTPLIVIEINRLMHQYAKTPPKATKLKA